MGYTVTVVGATDAVGTRVIQQLGQSTLPINKVRLLSSSCSAGRVLKYKGQDVTVELITGDLFEGVDIALFSADGSVSAKFTPYAVKTGAVVTDNTSYFRQNPDVPLVAPEANARTLGTHNGIITCSDYSTIQVMVALEPVRQRWDLSRTIVSAYQTVSGAGRLAINETVREIKEVINDGAGPENVHADTLLYGGDKKRFPIAFNVLVQVDVFTDDDYTYGEMKMTNETKKIMGEPDLPVSATCVHAPVLFSHSGSVYIETKEVAPIKEIRVVIAASPGAVPEDDVANQVYPQVANAVGKRETFIGRIHKDLDVENGIRMWVVSDSLLRGTVWSPVQIAETPHERGLIHPTRELKFELK